MVFINWLWIIIRPSHVWLKRMENLATACASGVVASNAVSAVSGCGFVCHHSQSTASLRRLHSSDSDANSRPKLGLIGYRGWAILS